MTVLTKIRATDQLIVDGDVSWEFHRLMNLPLPGAPGDAATKAYVDSFGGIQGFQGPQGPQGDQGNPGVRGFQGNQGFQGIVGPQGLVGQIGVQGVPGFAGAQGNQGFQGFQGNQGSQGTGAQGNQGPGNSGGSPGFDIASIIKIDGVSTLNPVDGTTINFTTSRNGVALFTGSAYASGASSLPSDSFGINVDGVPYTLNVGALQIGAGADKAFDLPFSGSIGVPLLAGAHTAFIFVSQSGLGFVASPGNPMTLTVVYPTLNGPLALASPITKQEAENTTGTITSATGFATVLVPGTLINIVLPSSQVILLEGLAGLLNSTSPDANGFNGQLGVRIDGVTDYFGTPSAWESIYVHYGAPVTVSKAVTLGPGAHTAQLIFRQAQTNTDREGRLANGVNNSVNAPSRLTAIYTVPQAVTPLTEVVVESDSPSDSTGSTSFVATGAVVGFSLATSSVVRASAFTTAVAGGGGNQYQATNIALNIDGTTYTAQSVESFGNSVGPQLVPMAVFKDIVLAPGSHTITLMFSKRTNAAGANGALQNTHLSVVYHA